MLTQEAKNNALEIFKKLLESASDNTDLKISITTETLLQAQGIEKPIVYVLADAYIKMTSLINNSANELAWYGIARRINNNYLIEDILVYPQTVTSTTVDADEEKCAKWFMELPDDVINNLRFQGHSHVNIHASPSGRDTDNWLKFANLLKPNEFMLLCIGNKKGDFYWNIYDKAINVLFENKDIIMQIVDARGNSISNWATEAIEKYIVKEVTPPLATSILLNGHIYDTRAIDKPKVTSKNNNRYKQMIAYIPDDLKDSVEYELESDVYFTDVVGVPGFYFSSLYGCCICSGETFRIKYPLKASDKRKTNRTKKENKN